MYVGVNVGVEVYQVPVGVGVSVGVGVFVGVSVGVCVSVGVFVGVDVFVGVYVSVGVYVFLKSNFCISYFSYAPLSTRAFASP